MTENLQEGRFDSGLVEPQGYLVKGQHDMELNPVRALFSRWSNTLPAIDFDTYCF